MSSTLLIGSCHPFSGKSALVLGLARQAARKGVPVRFGKPLATSLRLDRRPSPGGVGPTPPLIDDDVRFVGGILGLAPECLLPSLQLLEPAAARQRLLQGDLGSGAGFEAMRNHLNTHSEGSRCWRPPAASVKACSMG